MSKPRYRWWGYIKNVIRAYPALSKEYAEIIEQTITTTIPGMPSGGDAARKTEITALRELPRQKQQEFDAVRKAVAEMESTSIGRDTLRIIDMVFWKKTHTLSGAAYAVGISYETTKVYQRRFILAVAKNYGLLEKD